MKNPFLDTVKDVAGLLFRRIGTTAASFLVAQGIPAGSAEQAILAGSVLLGILFDLIVSKVHESAQTQRAVLAVRVDETVKG